MIAGYYSPMPPARTGVADYSAALVNALRATGEVRVNQDGDVNFYHLGNNPLHAPAYQRAREVPGVVVLHDAVLHHFLLGALSRDEYIAEFTYNYGEWCSDLAARLWERRARSSIDPDFFRFSLLKRAVATARAVVVHNPAAARIAREHGATRVVEIPHLFVPPARPSETDVILLREQWGARRGTFVFGVFGHLRESKRLTTVLRAFDNVVSSGVGAVLLVAGEFASPDLSRVVSPLLCRDRVVHTGYLSEKDFWRYAFATDACLNLRYPQAGETSGIGIRMMGIGKPVLFTSGDETAGYPETSCLRVDPGPAELDSLSHHMTWLAAAPGQAAAIGACAAVHIAEYHAADRVAAAFWSVLEGSR